MLHTLPRRALLPALRLRGYARSLRGKPSALSPAPLRSSSCLGLADRRAAETPLSASSRTAADVRDCRPALPPPSSPPPAPPLSRQGAAPAAPPRRAEGIHRPARRSISRRPLKNFRCSGTRTSPVGHCLPAIWFGAGIGREPRRGPLSLLFFFPFGCPSAVVAMQLFIHGCFSLR